MKLNESSMITNDLRRTRQSKRTIEDDEIAKAFPSSIARAMRCSSSSSLSSSGKITELETNKKTNEERCLRAKFDRTKTFCLICQARKIELVNPRTGLSVKTYEGAHAREVRDCAPAKDNSKFVSVGGDKGVFVWDVRTGQTLRRYRGHESFGVNAAKFLEPSEVSEDGRWQSSQSGYGSNVCVTVGYDRAVKFWDVRSNSSEAMESVSAFRDAATDVAVKGHKAEEIVVSSIDGTIKTFDVRKGEIRTDILGHPITAIDLSSDERLLVATLEQSVVLLDTSSGEVLQTYRGFANDEAVFLRATFTPDDKFVCLGDTQGSIHVWDLVHCGLNEEEEEEEVLGRSSNANNLPRFEIPKAHANTISNIEFTKYSFDSNTKNSKKYSMLTCSLDGFVKFWT